MLLNVKILGLGNCLQAPVSDREYRAMLRETPSFLHLAEIIIKEGKGEELMPHEADPCAPINALRFSILLLDITCEICTMYVYL